MVNQIGSKRVDGHESADAVNERIQAAFEDHWDELDAMYGWG